jgi:hypothetical protein
METRADEISCSESKVGSYGTIFSESLFNFEGPKLSLEARPAVGNKGGKYL